MIITTLVFLCCFLYLGSLFQTDPLKQVTNCSTEVDRTDWTMSGSCDVNKIYASDGRYTCLWFHIPEVGVSIIPLSSSSSSFSSGGGEEGVEEGGGKIYM